MKVFSEALSYLFRIWILGWWMILKTLLAVLIFKFFLIPLGFLEHLFDKAVALPREDTAIQIAMIAFVAFTVLIYVPLTFYVAASTVGFCRRITRTRPEEEAFPENSASTNA